VTDRQPTLATSPAMPSAREPAVSRCAVITSGDANRTDDALRRVVEIAQTHDVQLVLPRDEAAKHPGLGGSTAIEDELYSTCGIALVLGGDGTMLRALQRFLDTGTPVIGVNFGRVGFLTSLAAYELETRLPGVFAGDYERVLLPTVEVRYDGERRVAVNDVLVASAVQGRMAVLSWEVNGIAMGERGCDGVVVATPSGSTAYNLSAGGPVLGWGVDAIVVTFVAPHALDVRPLVLAQDHAVRVASHSRGFGSRVVVDGHASWSLEEGDSVEIRMAPERAVLATLPDRPFLQHYREVFAR
jgi:NAD+ kinase